MSNIIAQGATQNLEFTEAGGESADNWYIQKNEITIATNAAPDGWNLVWDGVNLALTVPSGAVVASDYNAVHLDGSSTQRASTGGFEVVALSARRRRNGLIGALLDES